MRHLGKPQDAGRTVDRVQVDVAALPADVDRVVIGASLDGAGTFGTLTGLAVEVGAPGAAAAIRCGLDASVETAMVFVEVYRRGGDWKVRAVGQGYDSGLAGMARDVGVSVDDEPAAAPAPCSCLPAPAAPISLEKQRLVRLEKDLAADPQLLTLVKTAGVSLEKRGLGEHTARVALVLDISASMRRLYDKGAVQRLAERVLSLGLRFDDDGEVDVFLFGAKAHHTSEGLRQKGYREFIDRTLREFPLEYGTQYGAAMSAVRQHYFGSTDDRQPAAARPGAGVRHVRHRRCARRPGRCRAADHRGVVRAGVLAVHGHRQDDVVRVPGEAGRPAGSLHRQRRLLRRHAGRADGLARRSRTTRCSSG